MYQVSQKTLLNELIKKRFFGTPCSCSELKVRAPLNFIIISFLFLPDCCLRNVMHGDKLDVQRPNSVMLGWRKSSKGPVKNSPGSCYFPLLGQELAVINPDLE